MNERQKLQQLFKFDLWCTRKLADQLIENDSFKEREACIAFLSHIINSQKIWFSRAVEMSADHDLDFWEEYDINEIKAKAKKAAQMWIDLIGDHDVNLDAIIFYQNSKGVDYQNALWQICNHLVVHGQHHRAQIALLLRRCGIEPAELDFINYARMDKVQKMLI